MNNAVTWNTLFTPFHLQWGFKAHFKCNYSNLFIESIICIIKSQQSTDMLEKRATVTFRQVGQKLSYCALLLSQDRFYHEATQMKQSHSHCCIILWNIQGKCKKCQNHPDQGPLFCCFLAFRNQQSIIKWCHFLLIVWFWQWNKINKSKHLCQSIFNSS